MRVSPLVMVALSVGLLAGAPVTSGQSAPVYAAITDVEITPTNPVPDQSFRIMATIVNHQRSPAALEISSVVLRTKRSGDFRVLDRVTELGVLAPGSSIPVPLGGSLADNGTHALRVEAYGWANGSFVKLRYPVIVDVDQQARPMLTVDPLETVAGTDTHLNVSVAVRDDSEIRGGLLTVRDEVTKTVLSRQIIGRLGSDELRRVRLPIRLSSPGQQPIEVTLEYVAGEGKQRVVRTVSRPAVESPEVDVAMTASQVTAGDEPRIDVSLANRGTVRASNMSLLLSHATGRGDARPLRPLQPGEHRTVSISPPEMPGGRTNATARLRYYAADRAYEERATVTISTRPGRIILTGIAIDRQGTRLAVSGHASNVGLAPVRSVVVRPTRTVGVRPIHPKRSYFVGTVSASDFVPFEVTVRATGNVTSIPLLVSGVHDGDQTRHIHRIPVDPPPDESVGAQTGTNPAESSIHGATLTVGVFGMIALAWRNRRADN